MTQSGSEKNAIIETRYFSDSLSLSLSLSLIVYIIQFYYNYTLIILQQSHLAS